MSRIGNYLNGNTGETDVGVMEWEIGSKTTYTNIQCVSMHGMFGASSALQDPVYGLAAFDTARVAIDRYIGNTTRPFATEVDFLVDVCNFDGDEFLRRSAIGGTFCMGYPYEFYGRIIAQFTAIQNVDRHLDAGRASISGYDLRHHIRGAWRVGKETGDQTYIDYARAMAVRILELRPDWEHALYGGFDYTEISWGALVGVILEMQSAGDIDAASYAEALEMADELIAVQGPDGSWGGSDYQTTAFGVLAFRADPWNWATPWHQALIQATNFLEDTATASPVCGWSYPPEYGEVNSEGMMALAAVAGLPFYDGFESGDTNAWSSSVGHTPLSGGEAFVRGPGLPRFEPFR